MKTIQEMVQKVRLDIYCCGWPPDKFIERIEAFATLVREDAQRKPPLTDEEHDKLMRGRSTLNYGRAVEAAHGITAATQLKE